MTTNTRVPNQFHSYLDRISEAFGGFDQVLNLLPDRDLEYLLTFPGFIHVVKPWAPLIDLREYGYQIDAPYTLLDEHFRFLKRGVAPNGFFGSLSAEVDTLVRASHGSFLHIRFESATQPVLGLLWVCNKLSPQQIKNQVSVWESQQIQRRRQLTVNEFFLSTQFLLPDDIVRVSFLPGIYRERFDSDGIINHPNVSVSLHRADTKIVYFYPQQSGWCLFEVLRGSERSILELTETAGTGLERFKLTLAGTYFLELHNRATTVRYPTIRSQPTIGASLIEDVAVRLEANLRFRLPHESVGSTIITLVPNVRRSAYLYSTLAGSGESRAYGEISFASTITGGSSITSASAVSDVMLVNASASAIAYWFFITFNHADVEAVAVTDATIFIGTFFDATNESASSIFRSDSGRATSGGGSAGTALYYADPNMLLQNTNLPTTIDPMEAFFVAGYYAPFTQSTGLTVEQFTTQGRATSVVNNN